MDSCREIASQEITSARDCKQPLKEAKNGTQAAGCAQISGGPPPGLAHPIEAIASVFVFGIGFRAWV